MKCEHVSRNVWLVLDGKCMRMYTCHLLCQGRRFYSRRSGRNPASVSPSSDKITQWTSNQLFLSLPFASVAVRLIDYRSSLFSLTLLSSLTFGREEKGSPAQAILNPVQVRCRTKYLSSYNTCALSSPVWSEFYTCGSVENYTLPNPNI